MIRAAASLVEGGGGGLARLRPNQTCFHSDERKEDNSSEDARHAAPAFGGELNRSLSLGVSKPITDGAPGISNLFSPEDNFRTHLRVH